MNSELKKLTLENFAKGAASELFDRELNAVLENINDPNTKADAARTISLTFTIKPDAYREEAGLSVEAKSKIAPVRHASGNTYFGKKNGKLVAYSHNINQEEMNLDQPLQAVDSEVAQ